MKYKIEENNDKLDISVNEIGNKKDNLLNAFQKCQQGQCSCPTDEYKKLDSLDIEESEDSIKLHIKSKPGTKIDASKIHKCMQHTTSQVESEE